jgi:hypothetical protein
MMSILCGILSVLVSLACYCIGHKDGYNKGFDRCRDIALGFDITKELRDEHKR